MSNVFFTSDLHFGHKNLLNFRSEAQKKLFPSIEYHDEWLIERWNSRVRPRDLVWVLGDVAWGSDSLQLFHRCNGTKNLILGNHDSFSAREYLPIFKGVYGAQKKYGVIMTHIPIHPEEMKFRGWENNVHGHIHSKERLLGEPQYICVNVDVRGALPVALDELRDIINRGVSDVASI